MQRKLTIDLSKDEVKKAIALYVTSLTGDEVEDTRLENSKTGDFICVVTCKTEQFGNKEDEHKEEA